MKQPEVWRAMDGPGGRTYYYPVDVPNPGDHVHVDTKDPESRGYGGRTLEFKLEDGEVRSVKGPWHGGLQELYEQTGIRLADLHYTKVTVEAQGPNGSPEVVYKEDDFVLGQFMRGARIAYQLADALGRPVELHVNSAGGGMAGMIHPGERQHSMATRRGDR